MNLPALAIERRAVTNFCTLLVLVAGVFCYFQLGQLEDPEFTVKTAAIVTFYPGASPEQVELEVTDRIETKLQEMSEIKEIYSSSRAGLSLIKVDIKDEYWSDRLPQVWDILRSKVRDVEASLPPGASRPDIGDDFGYVFGFLLAITSDGFSQSELEWHVKSLRKELSLVPGVARVSLWGEPEKRVFVDVTETQLSQLGLTAEQLFNALRTQNLMVDAGRVDFETVRMRIAPTGEFESPEAIGELAIAGLSHSGQGGAPSRDEIIRIRDFATVSFGYADPPTRLLRQNGLPAIAMAIAPRSGENVVHVGQAIDARLDELKAELPIGIGVERISWQSDSVSESINAFLTNLLQAIAIVFVVVAVTMGFRVGMIIGISGLIFPILGSFVVMWMAGIDLQRVSLGALIIAMGMMVDNAIVVVDGIVVRLGQGTDRKQAAIEAASQPAVALLGATVVACMAFYPIFASTYSTGEYAGSLFTVVAISLLLSWIFCQTITPVLALHWLPSPQPGQQTADPYQTPFFRSFRGLLHWAIRWRIPFLGGLVTLLLLSGYGFRFVPQLFFPDSSRRQIMIDYWAAEGTRIQQVADDLERIEQILKTQPTVASVSSFIGQGPPRFYLPVAPEDTNSAYAQIVVNTHTLPDVGALIDFLNSWTADNVPEAMVRVRRYAVGAFDDWKFEARFSGPADATPDDLRRLAEQGVAILRDNPLAKEVRTDWRQRVRKLVPNYNQERGRWSGVSRENVAQATRRAFDGIPVGQYREQDDLIPILFRNVDDERRLAAASLDTVQVVPDLSSNTVPVSQVIDGIDIEWEDPNIRRRDRRRAITVQCSPRRRDDPDVASIGRVRLRIDPAAARIPDGLGRRVPQRQRFAASSGARHRAGPRDHGADPGRAVQRLPPAVDHFPGDPVRHDRRHVRAADHPRAVRVHRLVGCDESVGDDDQERRGAVGPSQLEPDRRHEAPGRRGRSRRLAVASRSERRRHDRAGHVAPVEGRLLGFHVGHHHVRPGPGNHPDHGRRPRPLRPAVPNP
jgi:multidrug efflux pump subunit AcrB